MARSVGDELVSVPLGLVSLIWLRLYKPLVEADLPQTPGNRGDNGLGFAKEGWRKIRALSALDLRVGARFGNMTGSALHAAVRDAATTIAKMPAHFLTWPGTSEPVIKALRIRAPRAPTNLIVDEVYLRSFGEILVPTPLWRALARYDAWIEPALIYEWVRLMNSYAERQGRVLDPGEVARAMVWSEPARDVSFARRIALELMEVGPLHCVWSNKKLSERNLDIDHCLPWSAWPCEDLWNLMPADRTTNQQQKREKLPTSGALAGAHDRILDWWQSAYALREAAVAQRFYAEANSSLPISATNCDLDRIFDGVVIRRIALRADQQVEEWAPMTNQ